jgi:thiopeptide-type bacteriocin biosynthesis protein
MTEVEGQACPIMSDEYERLCASLLERLRTDPNRNGDHNLGVLVEHAAAVMARARREIADDAPWIYLRIGVDAGHGTALVVTKVAPVLAALEEQRLVRGWWWLNKRDICGSAVRLRILMPPRSNATARAAITDAVLGIGAPISTLCYEPELCLFGGAKGMEIAHEHFIADSRFLARWLARGQAATNSAIPDGLSFALVLWLARAAGLDLFEMWDVFSRIYAMRRLPSFPEQVVASYRRIVGRVVEASREDVCQLWGDEESRMLTEHVAELSRLGAALSRLHYEGRLERGLREVLAALALFQWNRAGLSWSRQTGLSYAAVVELRARAGQRAELPES